MKRIVASLAALILLLTPALAASISSSQPGPVYGTQTNDSAGTGFVGQRLDASAALSSVSLTTATAANITSLSVTAGDWECDGTAYFFGAATTTTVGLQASLGTTSATLNGTVGAFGSVALPNASAAFASATYQYGVPIPPLRFSLSATTTVYLVGFSTFAVSTMVAGGNIHCVRVR